MSCQVALPFGAHTGDFDFGETINAKVAQTQAPGRFPRGIPRQIARVHPTFTRARPTSPKTTAHHSRPPLDFYPQYDDMISQHVGLVIDPKPESLLRLWFVVVPSNSPVIPEEPPILPFERVGFSVVGCGVIVAE